MALRLLSDVLLSAVPAYRTYVAVTQQDPAAVREWLTYWVVATCLHLAETVEWLWSWMPLYWLAKMAFSLWLVFGGGAATIYNRAVVLLLARWEGVIDSSLALARDSATAGLSRAAASSMSRSSELLTTGMGMLARLQAQQALANAAAALANAAPGAVAAGAGAQQPAASTPAPAELDPAPAGAGSEDEDARMPARFGPTVRHRRRGVVSGRAPTSAAHDDGEWAGDAGSSPIDSRFGRPSDGVEQLHAAQDAGVYNDEFARI